MTKKLPVYRQLTLKEERFLIHPVGMYRVSKYWLFQLYQLTASSMPKAWMRLVDVLIKAFPQKVQEELKARNV